MRSEKHIHEAISTYEEASNTVQLILLPILTELGLDQNNHNDNHDYNDDGDLYSNNYYSQGALCTGLS